MTKPFIQIGDEVREMTDDEFATHQKFQADELKRQEEIGAKVKAKEAAQAKLAALGLTVEDLQALGL